MSIIRLIHIKIDPSETETPCGSGRRNALR
jgi:hypothetical protein